MTFLDRLIKSSNSLEDLELFIENNSIEIYDFFISQSFRSISNHRLQIEGYVLPFYRIYKHLDFSESKNRSFVLSLLDVSERFALLTEFQQLIRLSQLKEIEINSRLKAASKFLVGIHTPSDYFSRLTEIIDYLAESFINEEDIEYKVVSTLVHYYIEVLNNCGRANLNTLIEFRKVLINELNKENRKFLFTKELTDILNLAFDNLDSLYEQIHNKLDEILERSNSFLPFNIEPYLIELNTDYAIMLESKKASFMEIRQLCTSLYSQVASDEIFWSLQRGVKVLTDQNQLLAYINSYGPMHYKKLITSIEYLPEKIFNKNPHCIDWGCGQGMASITLLEYLKENEISQSISQITLIEPSLIALKRASLHVSKFTNNTKIINTINKDLDSLAANDFLRENKTRIHLFSNILDMDVFSLLKLIELIKNNFSGENYFLCASPFITDSKTARIDSFVNAFSNNDGFEELYKINNKTGEWMNNGWTRVVRVFKCII